MNIKLSFRNFIGKYPKIYYFLYSLKPNKYENLTNQSTELVIEGFPRSANSFTVAILRRLQPKKVNIAHHHHVPAQIIKAINLQIPILVLIRSPKDAVISFKIYDSSISIAQALRTYISFYQEILNYKDKYVVGLFEEVISDYTSIINKINNKFKTNFVSEIPDRNFVKQILA
jgi:hypothetical protein